MSRLIDLTGKKFGRLMVEEKADYYISPKGHKMLMWTCKCRCGNYVKVLGNALTSGRTRSCGCIAKETGKINQAINVNSDRYKGSKIGQLTMKIPSNNTSGYKGVYWEKDICKWRARIAFKGRKISLGCYENIEDAIKARKEAEEKYFNPIIEEFNEVRKDESYRCINSYNKCTTSRVK